MTALYWGYEKCGFDIAVLFICRSGLCAGIGFAVVCTIGTNCWVQQYVDHDATAQATDYSCGVASYDGHDGGWETQYCQMLKGSVVVKAGQTVAAGHKLGEIGFSGHAAFPHVHLTVRKNGKADDPFSADGKVDCKATDRSLWHPQAQPSLAYKGTDLLKLQWATRVFDAEEISTGPLPTSPPKGDEAALVLYAQAINMHKEDVVNLKVFILDGEPVVNSVEMKRNRALQQLHAGKKMLSTWPSGNYTGRLEVVRDGGVVMQRVLRFALP